MGEWLLSGMAYNLSNLSGSSRERGKGKGKRGKRGKREKGERAQYFPFSPFSLFALPSKLPIELDPRHRVRSVGREGENVLILFVVEVLDLGECAPVAAKTVADGGVGAG